MQKLELSEISGLDNKQIDAKVKEMRTSLFNMRMQKAASGLEKPHTVRIAKGNIARLLTVKNSKGK